ncbi:hypothetical protein [Nostoc sp.]|uniref:hypothetical protein n=1 Tax=Nostoc sp. TaxID=1180 RepID=UPI002FF6A665
MMLIFVDFKVIQPNITVSDRNCCFANGRGRIFAIPFFDFDANIIWYEAKKIIFLLS